MSKSSELKNTTDSYEEDRLRKGSTSISVQPELVKQYKDSNLFATSLQNDDVQDFDVIWDHALLSVSEMPSDMILEGLYKSKLQNSVQLQTVLALYDQETARNKKPNYSQKKTAVKLHVGQMMITRNFRVWIDVVQRGSVTKNQKGKKASLRGKFGECFQWKAHGQCSKGDSFSSSHDTMASGNSGGGQRQKKTIVFSCIPFEGKTD